MMTFVRSSNGLCIGIPGNSVIGRIYGKPCPDKTNRYRLCFEINDTGDATFEAALAAFRYARATGEIPIIEDASPDDRH